MKRTNSKKVDIPSSKEVLQKVEKFENFRQRLKDDLKAVLEKREDIARIYGDYDQLKGNLLLLKEAKETRIKTMVNLGCEFYMQAVVPDATRVFVDVGLGIFLEMTLDEALNFVPKRQELLKSRVDALSEQAARISAHIKVVQEGIAELLRLENEGA